MVVKLTIELEDLTEALKGLILKSHELDCDLDRFVDKINSECHILEDMKAFVFLSQYIDTKLYKVANVATVRPNRERALTFSPQILANIEQIFSEKTKTIIKVTGSLGNQGSVSKRLDNFPQDLHPTCVVLSSHSKLKPRSLKEHSEAVSMIQSASILKEILSLFFQYFPSGPDPISYKIIEHFKYIKNADKLLKEKLDTLILTFRDKKETLFQLSTLLNQRINAEAIFKEHSSIV